LPAEVGSLLKSLADRFLGPEPDLPRPQGLDPYRRTTVILWSSAVLLILLLFRMGFSMPGDFYSGWAQVGYRSLGGRIYWSLWGFLFYLIVPLGIVWFVFKESPARYGLRLVITWKTVRFYLLLLAVMTPLLWWASTQPGFLNRYPFVDNLSTWREILIWELFYVSRFVALEFFFRGFLLFGTEERLGRNHAVAMSTVPYAVVHYAKPFPEALGAIVAGAVLGWLALRTRTIAGGVIIHCTIALSMDLLALWRHGVIF